MKNIAPHKRESKRERTPSPIMNPTHKKNSEKKLPVEIIPGIGRHTPRALAFYGIRTVEQFALFTEKEVVALLGNSGRKLLMSARQIMQPQQQLPV